MKTPKRCMGLAALLAVLGVLVGAGYAALVSPVVDAAKRGDVESLKAELRSGADVNAAQGDGFTALHWAAKTGHLEVATVLIAAGADIEATTRLGSHMPLHVAAAAGQAGVAEALLDAGAPADAMTSTGAEPIHLAAAAGVSEVVTALIAHGASVDARETEWGLTPLMFASVRGRVGAVRTLMEAGADASATADVLDVVERARLDMQERRERETRLAETRGGSGVLRAERPLPANGTDRRSGAGTGGAGSGAPPPDPLDPYSDLDPNEPRPKTYEDRVGTHGGLTALLLAAREGQIETAMALLDAGAAVNRRAEGSGTTPLLMATINGHFDLAIRLLERGADPTLADSQNATPLYGAINTQWIPKARHPQPADYLQETSHLELLQALLDAGADVNARIDSSLWYTVYNVDQLGVDRSGATAFWRAAYSLDVPAMKLLVANGADPHLPTVKVPERRRLPMLIEEGDPDPSGLPPAEYGDPAVYPIHAASGVGYGLGLAANSHRHAPDAWHDAVRYLVEECGADAAVRDHNGYSTIHHAASRGDTWLVQYLIDHGADPLAVARTGQTTIDLANGPVQRINPFPETIALLASYGARNNNACVGC